MEDRQRPSSRHRRPGRGPAKRKPGGGRPSLGSANDMGTPPVRRVRGTHGSETLLQQGASRPPEGRLHAETHITACAAGQPAHPGSGGHAPAQAAHGEDSPWGPARMPRASPTPSPQLRGEGNEATKETPPPPRETRQAPMLGAPHAAARPRGHGGDINTPRREAVA